MKKKLLLGLGVLFAILLGVYGRDAIGLYYLVDTIEADAKAHDADAGVWPQVVDGCNGCHGSQGNSLHQRYPSLAGQPAAYIETQLRNFASGERSYPAMGPMAMILSEEEIKTLADYYARHTAAENTWFKPDPSLREQGMQLVKAGACAACHGENLMGQGAFPRLASQGADYLMAQLDAFADGRRVDPTGSMQAITAKLTADERKAISHYLASLAPKTQ
jgi:cytochrome c553